MFHGGIILRCAVNFNYFYRFCSYSATNIVILFLDQQSRPAKAVNRTRVQRKFYRTDNFNGPWPTLRFGSPFVDFRNDQYIILYYIIYVRTYSNHNQFFCPRDRITRLDKSNETHTHTYYYTIRLCYIIYIHCSRKTTHFDFVYIIQQCIMQVPIF